jgi:hypothetical protein
MFLMQMAALQFAANPKGPNLPTAKQQKYAGSSLCNT